MAVFILAMLVVIAGAVWSGWTLMRATASPDDKHAAQTILIAIVAACVGYLVRK